MKTKNIIVNIFIVLLAVSPAFALGEGNRNLLLIGFMSLSPLVFFYKPIIIPKIDIPLLFLCLMLIFFPLLFHPETMRWATVLYSCMFCLFFMAFARIFYFSSFSLNNFEKILKYLLYAYCIVLIIQQFCVLTGLPIFNVSSYSIKEPWKLNSLMSEPSHSARVVSVLMYLFINTQRRLHGYKSLKESFKENKLVWSAFLWTVLTMISSTAYIFSFIVVLSFFDVKKFMSSTLLIVGVIGVLLFFSENKSIKRVTDVIEATLTLEKEEIIKADGSASYRIVPTMQGARCIGWTTLNDWFGYGVDADFKLVKPLPGAKNGNSGAFYLWINYGLIVAILFWIFSLKMCYITGDWIIILVWFLCVFLPGGLNSQIIWLVLTLQLIRKDIEPVAIRRMETKVNVDNYVGK